MCTIPGSKPLFHTSWVTNAAILLVLSCVLSACTPFAPARRSPAQVDLPADYSISRNGTREVDHWWEAFGSPELDALVETALRQSPDIRSAWAKLRQARAVAVKSGAGLFPSVQGSLEGSRTRTYVDEDLISDTKSSSLSLAASYELDLWGKIRSGESADRLQAGAAYEDVQATAISLAAEVTGAWVDLLAARQEIRVVQEQIQTNKNLLRLLLIRFENGMSTALDVTQQKETLASSRSELPTLQARKRLALNKLAVLLGQADPKVVHVTQSFLPRVPPRPETGLPADLLSSRPDVRAAFLRLRSADWEVSVARADRLPALSLSARTAVTSDTFSLAWGDWLTKLGADLTGPVFDAGSRRAEVRRTRAVVDQRLAEYVSTVLTAVKDVQDALANEAGQEEKLTRVGEELQAAKQAREQARIRYLNGQSDYLNYLTQLRSVQRLQRTLVTARADLLSYRIALYRALGGDWTESEVHVQNR